MNFASMSYGQCQMMIPDDMSKLSAFEEKPDSLRRKCKIICTMGPSCWDEDKLVQLIDCGMNICRLNFSHGDHEVHGATVKRIRAAAAPPEEVGRHPAGHQGPGDPHRLLPGGGGPQDRAHPGPEAEARH